MTSVMLNTNSDQSPLHNVMVDHACDHKLYGVVVCAVDLTFITHCQGYDD